MSIASRRYERSAAWLSGHGMEIGAGPNPQPVPARVQVAHFDIRSAEELAAYFGHAEAGAPEPISRIRELFPSGADFLIAHHVLEHVADPIGELRQWLRMVRSGGTFVLSLPFYAECPDRDRLVPPLEHLVFDHVLGRGPDAFESREHVASFLCSWIEDAAGLAGLSPVEVCRTISRETRRSDHDFHWHAYDPQLAYELIVAAARFEGLEPRFHVDPRNHDGSIDMLAVFELGPITREGTVVEAMRRMKAKLVEAAAVLDV